jgi:hypothetical protein
MIGSKGPSDAYGLQHSVQTLGSAANLMGLKAVSIETTGFNALPESSIFARPREINLKAVGSDINAPKPTEVQSVSIPFWQFGD